ncbi:Venom serine carboxypeptidase [Pseudolycoriella hygida]|uniref:Carboxypeptidase n=1 Tax=Pseudolycoriella hygida TaxID=35572 RepID=A0A9Q0N0H0_9DIPT|nr:Venom serine carboxypeptidase [Pseudolycoriella hygida]
MKYLLLVSFLTALLGVVSTFNPYPRYKEYREVGDNGEALFLTPYIEKGQIDLAKKLAVVNHDEMKWLESYAGYLTVNKQFNSNIFFWFFPAQTQPSSAPVVLWLQGGPGASSMFGLFIENGPVFIDSDLKLQPREFSWHLDYNLLYIDSPVGTGYSFTEDEAGYAKNEVDVGRDLFETLRQFFTLFSELRKNSFYIAGESYAGKYIPALGHAIYNHSRSTDSEDKINLQGVAIGNGLTDPVNQMKYGDYLYQLGLIDTNGQKQFHEYEKLIVELINKGELGAANDAISELIATPTGSLFKNLTGFDTYYNYLITTGDDSDARMGEFVQQAETRKAIHVGNYTFHDSDGANKVAEYLNDDIMDSVKDWLIELLDNYKVLMYNGQLDILVGYPLTINYLKKLEFSAADEYKTAKRYIWKVDNDVAGYVKHAGNLTEVLVRNASHMVPRDQPKWALDMMLRMTTGKGFS